MKQALKKIAFKALEVAMTEGVKILCNQQKSKGPKKQNKPKKPKS